VFQARDPAALLPHLSELETAAAALVVPGPSLALRPYQREALDAQAAGRGERAVVLVHRDELVGQTLEKLAVVAPGLPVGVVKATRYGPSA
jgi:superfamily II DNA or RNA helicase